MERKRPIEDSTAARIVLAILPNICCSRYDEIERNADDLCLLDSINENCNFVQ